MGRRAALVVALAATALTGCTEEKAPSPSIPAASPQVATLDWVEQTSAEGPALVFGVSELRVKATGWEADISMRNDSKVRLAIPPDAASSDRAFGLMLFADGEQSSLDDLAGSGRMPPVRVAWTTEPPTPVVLEPGATWKGTISATGRLQSGAYVRVSFGPFAATGSIPEDLPKHGQGLTTEGLSLGPFTWITDHAYRLR